MTKAEELLAAVQDTLAREDGFDLVLSDGSVLVFDISEEGDITAHAGRWTFHPITTMEQ